MRSNERAIEKSELDYYLGEEPLSSTTCTKFDVLDFWKANSARFPCLSKMACDILSIPITTVASESAFSIGSRVLTKYRSTLIPENVEALICARNWILGFQWNGNINIQHLYLLKLFVLIIYVFCVCLWQRRLRLKKRKLLLFHFFQVQIMLLLHLQIPIEE